MFVLIAGGGGPPEEPKAGLISRLKKYLVKSHEEPGRLNEQVVLSLVSRACSVNEVNKLLEIGRHYHAEWTATEGIKYHPILGWVELLQYRPGILAATILEAQEKSPNYPLSGSFQRAVAGALKWPLQKVLGFQMGVSQTLLENPAGATDEAYLDGMALGYMFHESRKHNEGV